MRWRKHSLRSCLRAEVLSFSSFKWCAGKLSFFSLKVPPFSGKERKLIEFEGHELSGSVMHFWLVLHLVVVVVVVCFFGVCLFVSFLKHQLEESEEGQTEERGEWLHASVRGGGLRDNNYREILGSPLELRKGSYLGVL